MVTAFFLDPRPLQAVRRYTSAGTAPHASELTPKRAPIIVLCKKHSFIILANLRNPIAVRVV